MEVSNRRHSGSWWRYCPPRSSYHPAPTPELQPPQSLHLSTSFSGRATALTAPQTQFRSVLTVTGLENLHIHKPVKSQVLSISSLVEKPNCAQKVNWLHIIICPLNGGAGSRCSVADPCYFLTSSPGLSKHIVTALMLFLYVLNLLAPPVISIPDCFP